MAHGVHAGDKNFISFQIRSLSKTLQVRRQGAGYLWIGSGAPERRRPSQEI
jgi:hypothetical protein